MNNQKLRYDGSDSEMMKLGLIDESGSLIVERRNEYKQYMQIVQQNRIIPKTDAPDCEKLEEFFRARDHRRNVRIAKCRAFFTKLFGYSR